ncbi:MAG: ROK family protein [Patescibacteria group bacterium]
MDMSILGIDIGGTEIKILCTTAPGERRGLALTIKTLKTKRRFFDALSQAVKSVIAENSVVGIGIGAPGIVDPKRGILMHAPNLLFLNGWNIKRFFKKFKVPIKIDNDSRCFLRAEAFAGAGKGKKYIAVLTIGTGIGGGFLIDGRVYFGKHSGAGEFGHMVVNQGKTLEQLAGKRAFKKLDDKNEIVGIGVANIINAFDPEVVIIGGGALYAKRLQISKICLVARRYIMSPIGKKTPIVAGRIGEYAGALGATLLFPSEDR